MSRINIPCIGQLSAEKGFGAARNPDLTALILAHGDPA
jgi:hypothetical protein